MIYVANENQHAQVLAKALEREKFEKHTNFLMNVGWCRSENGSESVCYN